MLGIASPILAILSRVARGVKGAGRGGDTPSGEIPLTLALAGGCYPFADCCGFLTFAPIDNRPPPPLVCT